VLLAPPISARRRAALLARAPSRSQPLPPGPGVTRPRLSAARACEACAAHRCRSSPEPPCLCHAGSCGAEEQPPSLPHFLLHAAPHPEPLPLACLPRVRFKMSRPPRRALFSPPSLSSAHGHGHMSVTRSPHFPNSRPHRRSSRRCPHRISDRRRHRFSPPPKVRPAYPPPFPYLGPPSPLSSSPAAPGATRGHRRPSLR
jgi:hypothetical protein